MLLDGVMLAALLFPTGAETELPDEDCCLPWGNSCLTAPVDLGDFALLITCADGADIVDVVTVDVAFEVLVFAPCLEAAAAAAAAAAALCRFCAAAVAVSGWTALT